MNNLLKTLRTGLKLFLFLLLLVGKVLFNLIIFLIKEISKAFIRILITILLLVSIFILVKTYIF